MKELPNIQPPQHYLSIFFDNFHPRPVTRHFRTAPLMKWSIEAQTTAQGKVSCPRVQECSDCSDWGDQVQVPVSQNSEQWQWQCDAQRRYRYRVIIDTHICRYRVIHIDNRYRHPDVDTDTARHHVGSQAGLRQGSFIFSFNSNPSSPSCLWYLDDIHSRKVTTSRIQIHIFQLFRH